MNITEAIKLANSVSKHGMPIETAMQFWADIQDFTYSGKQIPMHTYNTIKLIESLLKKDTKHIFIDPDNQSIIIRTTVGEKAKGKKQIPHTLWCDVIDANGKIEFSFTYVDHTDGMSKVMFTEYSAHPGIHFIAKGWKKIRSFFESPVAIEPAKTSVAA